MLFKHLKEAIMEADQKSEEETEQPSEEQEKPEVEKPRKPQAAVDKVKNASDGVGNEAYELSTEIGEMLQKSLPMFFDVAGVEISNGFITIKGLKDKKTGELVALDRAQAIMGQIIQPTMDKFVSEGKYGLQFTPISKSGTGSFLITVTKVTETEENK